ncbi:AAA family ATPase [Stenotrophomonas ginsengisoli]|uniref:AAA family ATPase n=1 Tax=Stenotrophomonas ginsengisoli TaxID=336566 RepID=UPI00070F9FD2|nr:ATP-binding protein [Stenotrophomonas ginsengisoli]
MGSSSSRAGFVENQRIELHAEKARCEQAIHQAQAGVDAAYRAAEQAVVAMRAPWDAALADQEKKIRKDASRNSLLPALTLTAAVSGKRSLLLWIALAAAMYFFGTPLRLLQLDLLLYAPGYYIDALIPLLAYAGLVWLGRSRLIKRRASSSLAQLRQLAGYRLQALAFGDKYTDGRKHPYPAVRVPASNPADPSLSWTLNNKHDYSNAVFVGFTDELDKDPLALVCLPYNNQPADLCPIRQIDELSAVAGGVAELASAGLNAHAGAIAALQQACVPLQREQQRLAVVQTRLQSLLKVEKNWQDVAMPADTLETIIQLVDRFAAGIPPLPKGMLLWGPPGTGKTLIARKLAEHVDCHFKAVTIADLKAEYIGQTGPKVKSLWEECRSKAPTILFVDECESAFARRGGGDTDAFGNELVQTFIAEWDGFNQGSGNVLVIGATNRRELIDDAVMSRFTTAIELPAPNAEARERILNAEFAKARLPYPTDAQLVRETSGMSGRDLATLVAKVMSTHTGGQPAYEDFIAAVAQLRGKSSTSVEALGWDDIILPAATRREFESLGKELVHAEELARMNMPVPRGILLYGPPGTGKTQVARVLASQSGLSFMAASSSDIKSGNLGSSGQKVKQLFEKARTQAPCILFLDELDTIARSRDRGDVMTTEIVAQLLQEMDGISTKKGQVFLLAASNHPDSIDSALLSRLERKIMIDLPDLDARQAILRLQLAGKPLDFELDTLLPALAAASEGKSGRDLQSQVTAATRLALQRAMIEHGDPTKVQITAQDLACEFGLATPA